MEDEMKTKHKVKLVPVRVVSANIENALVEFALGGLFQRATIPAAEIVDGKASDEILIAGIPYGTAWEFVELSVGPIALANYLRANGVWTYEDAARNTNMVISALQAVYGVDLAALLKYARDNK
jgi:hypothetical protein